MRLLLKSWKVGGPLKTFTTATKLETGYMAKFLQQENQGVLCNHTNECMQFLDKNYECFKNESVG